MKSLMCAIAFLTRLPLVWEGDETDVGKAAVWFPVVGALIGAVLFLGYSVLRPLLPATVTAAFVLVLSVLITGGLHLDGLADTCDGMYAGRDRESILRIMKDTHPGAMGVIGIGLVLLCKFALIVALPADRVMAALVLAGLMSRGALVLAAYRMRYARAEGTGKSFVGTLTPAAMVSAAGLMLLTPASWLGVAGFVVTAAVAAVVLLSRRYFAARIGGVTGDTLGAVNELAEVLVMVVILGCHL